MGHTLTPVDHAKLGRVVFGSGKIEGTDFRDLLMANDTNSTLEGGWGNDTLIGGDGNDVLGAGVVSLWQHPDENLLQGGAGNDTLWGAAENDTLIGGAGNDTLEPNGGKNLLVGGSGKDVFEFGHGAPTVPGRIVGENTILDFTRSDGDKIDISALNYVGTVGVEPKDMPFKFIGTAPFSGDTAEVRFEHQKGNTLIFLDSRFAGVDPDGKADDTITLQGTITLVGSDFIL